MSQKVNLTLEAITQELFKCASILSESSFMDKPVNKVQFETIRACAQKINNHLNTQNPDRAQSGMRAREGLRSCGTITYENSPRERTSFTDTASLFKCPLCGQNNKLSNTPHEQNNKTVHHNYYCYTCSTNGTYITKYFESNQLKRKPSTWKIIKIQMGEVRE